MVTGMARLSHSLVIALLMLLAAPLAAQATPQAPSTAPVTQATPVLGQSRMSAEQIAAWFASRKVTPAIAIPIIDLARIFVDEGNAQNVRGDIAFAQSVLETGWFRYQGSMVKPTDNNYSGLGACDSCTNGNRFATPELGVRAQIQHLWAYADPAASPTATARPLADARFTYVRPYGRASTWEAMGQGNWATGQGYSDKILALYAEMLRHAGIDPATPSPVTPLPVTPTGPLMVIVTRRGAVRLGDLRAMSDGTLSAAQATFGPGTRRPVRGICHVHWRALDARGVFRPAPGGAPCADDARLVAATLRGAQWVTPSGVAPGVSAKRLRGAVRASNGARLAFRVHKGVVAALVVHMPARA